MRVGSRLFRFDGADVAGIVASQGQVASGVLREPMWMPQIWETQSTSRAIGPFNQATTPGGPARISDDSHWRIISRNSPWQDQGVSRPRDFFWYRLHVRLTAQHAPLSLLFGYSAFPYEVTSMASSSDVSAGLPPGTREWMELWSALSNSSFGCRR